MHGSACQLIGPGENSADRPSKSGVQTRAEAQPQAGLAEHYTGDHTERDAERRTEARPNAICISQNSRPPCGAQTKTPPEAKPAGGVVRNIERGDQEI
jgi:hypothetical protein